MHIPKEYRTDYILISIIGCSVGLLALFPITAFGIAPTASVVGLSIAGFTLFAIAAMTILKLLTRRWLIFNQLGKFAAVGTLSSFIDLAILNILMLMAGVSAGLSFSVFKGISFLIAQTNGYFWNRSWTFRSPERPTLTEYVRFTIFTSIGFGLNVGVASFLVNVIHPPFSLTLEPWANISAVIAIFVAMTWNFLSYRYIVFKSSA